MAKDVEAERLLIIKAANVANAAFMVVSPYDLLFWGSMGESIRKKKYGVHTPQHINKKKVLSKKVPQKIIYQLSAPVGQRSTRSCMVALPSFPVSSSVLTQMPQSTHFSLSNLVSSFRSTENLPYSSVPHSCETL